MVIKISLAVPYQERLMVTGLMKGALPDASSTISRALSIPSNDHLYPPLLQGFYDPVRNPGVGDDVVDLVQVTDLGQTSFVKLGTVGKDNDGLCRFHHLGTQACLIKIGGGKTEFKVNAIHAHKEQVAGYFFQGALGRRTYYG